jgi:NADH-quinone oxidoreductase subunit C
MNMAALLEKNGLILQRFELAETGFKVSVEPSKLVEVATNLYQNGFRNLTMLTARCTEDGFRMVYIVDNWAANEKLWIFSDVPKNMHMPSLTPFWPAADWLEREVYDMFGVEFDGHPNMIRILTPDDFDKFPLRKDFTDVD